MGRRSRARGRAATAARAEPAAPAGRPRRGLLGRLNPFSLRPSRNRARYGAIGFGLSAVLFGVLAWATGEPSWFNSAVLLAILAVAWGIRAALMRPD